MSHLEAPAAPPVAAARQDPAFRPDPLGPLNLYAKATAGAAFLLLFAGGLVTSTGSGLAVPDWPLSFGRYFPRMTGGVFFEHGHRMVAGTVGLMTLALAAWILRAEGRRWVRAVAALAAAAILVQAALGGLTVLLKLPPAVSIAHAVLGQTVFCLLLLLAQATSSWFREPRSSMAASPWRACAVGAAEAFLQLVLGAFVRHTGHGLIVHVLWGVAAWFLLARAALLSLEADASLSAGLSGPACFVMALLPLQVFLGASAWIVKSAGTPLMTFWRSGLPTAHLAAGAAVLGASVVWTLRARRAAGLEP